MCWYERLSRSERERLSGRGFEIDAEVTVPFAGGGVIAEGRPVFLWSGYNIASYALSIPYDVLSIF